MKLNMVTLFVISASSLTSQEFLWQRIMKLTEAEQFVFVDSFIAEDLKKQALVDHDERSAAIGMLMLNKSEPFIPLFEAKIQHEMKSPSPESSRIIDRAAGIICNAGTAQALEALERVFRDDKPQFDRNIPTALSSGYSRDRLRTFKLWYKALESPNLNLRAAANSMLKNMYGREGALGDDLQTLVEAMTSLRGHLPGEEEVRNDPIILAIEGQDMSVAYNVRRKVLELSNQMRLKKSQESKTQ
jgi:hypothetical protein